MKFLSFFGVLFFTSSVFSQELNCEVQINFDRVTNANTQIFKTLQTAVSDFMNKTSWTDKKIKNREKIECSVFINISEFDNNSRFVASIQVQSTRPVYMASYLSPIMNINDKDFSFSYVEFEMMNFNPNNFDSNLVSVLAYYAYIILGMDADSFEPLGGTNYFQIANGIMNVAQSSGFRGWNQADGMNNRYFLVSDLLSNTFDPIRLGLYDYHVNGLDAMVDNPKVGKEKVKAALMELSKIQNVRPNAYLSRIFFDAKADEIQQVFSAGFPMNLSDLKEQLIRISPTNADKWATLK
ncbi:MAG: DUF4835 family protein [Flavobacteriales bacterium]|nr:DUF4835 family protein [Flavobacteriales bacterium]